MTHDIIQNDEIFWLDDPMVLFQKNNYYKFVPTTEMTYVEKVNAFTRFFIFLALLLIIFCGWTEYIYIPIMGIIIVIIAYFVHKKNNNDSDHFNKNDNDSDHFNKNDKLDNDESNSDHHDINIIDTQDADEPDAIFSKWLYEHPPICKEDQSACLKYEDLRFSR